MTVQTTKKIWTDEELLAMPRDGVKREIVRGELLMSPASFDHGNIISRLMTAMGRVVFEKQLGELADGQTGFRLKSEDVFSPDISFVVTARVAEHRRRGSTFFEGSPDLMVEVLSPSDTIDVMEEKLAQLFSEGMRLAWVVHPRRRSVHVYHSLTESRVLTGEDVLDGENVIPGFKMELSRIFV